ncbi:hypothetical protein [Actinomadura craniellae]|uniref:hypothetical protein n=1 Tax=Actinomadura craniellae TaxID=2231787 RepID=UPI001314450E|nr:hypothetical protein [Actinomadura craniellae]
MVDLLMVLVLHTYAMLTQAQALIGVVAAVLAAVLAARGSWHVTDRLMAWRQRPRPDED